MYVCVSAVHMVLVLMEVNLLSCPPPARPLSELSLWDGGGWGLFRGCSIVCVCVIKTIWVIYVCVCVFMCYKD